MSSTDLRVAMIRSHQRSKTKIK